MIKLSYLLVEVMQVYVGCLATFPGSFLVFINHLMLKKQKTEIIRV